MGSIRKITMVLVRRCCVNDISVYLKGQLISERLFDVLNFPKKQRKISALESKKWSNHKIKAHYNDFNTNYIIKYKKLLLFW